MKVLHSMYTLEALPVLEPHKLFHLRHKRLLHISFDLLLGFFCREASNWIIVQLELGPNDEVYDV
jgi:hypothetical protein